MEQTTTNNKSWMGLNTVLGVGALASALGLGITALNRNSCGKYSDSGADCPISRRESALEAEVAMLKADRSTDAKILELYNVVAANDKAAGAQIAENAVQIALNKQANDFQIAAVNREFGNVYSRIDRNEARLDSLTNEIVPISKICPQPLSACQSIGIQGCIIPTEPTDYSVTTLNARAKAKAV